MAAAPDPGPPFEAVLFDCDSTLSTVEGIECLTERLDAATRERVARLTDEAMAGRVPLDAVFGERLDLVRPSGSDLDRVGQRYVETCVPGARETVAALHALGKRVEIVSGGLRAAVLHLAAHLGVAAERVHAVEVALGPDGGYLGFDRGAPLARAGGKLELARVLAPGGRGVLVGDGATDLEARPALARFVCFAGVVRRDAVAAAADVVVEEEDLRAVLPHLLDGDERARLAAWGEDPARGGRR